MPSYSTITFEKIPANHSGCDYLVGSSPASGNRPVDPSKILAAGNAKRPQWAAVIQPGLDPYTSSRAGFYVDTSTPKP